LEFNCPTKLRRNELNSYTKIVEELPEIRRDTVGLAREAMAEHRRADVLVNQRAEGNAPVTVQALALALG
jgi:hypothetical protein